MSVFFGGQNPTMSMFGGLTKTTSFILLLSYCVVAEQQPCLDSSAILWCDEFNTPGVPNKKYWNYDLGAGGWGNQEVQTYAAENAVIGDDGLLHILVTREGDAFTSARMKTEDKVSFLYVRIESSIRVPNLSNGLWPAIWLLGTNFPTVGWPKSGEIDISEWGSAEAIAENRLHTTAGSAMHWDEDGEHVLDTDYIVVDEPPSLDQDFHVYAVDWTPTEITFYLDDAQIFSKNITGPEFEAFHEPFFLLLNMAVGGDYTGIYVPTTQGGDYQVDWIRVYDNGSGSQVTCESCIDDDPSGGNSVFRWFTSRSLGLFVGLNFLPLILL